MVVTLSHNRYIVELMHGYKIIIEDTCTLSLCLRVGPTRDYSFHPHTYYGDALSLVVMQVGKTRTDRSDPEDERFH